MVDAHETIDIPVPDYSAFLHTQTILTRADQLVPGDEILIPDARPPLSALPVLRGQVYRVQLSRAAVAHDGPGWTLVTFGASMTRFRVEPHDELHRVVEHDPPTCAYCLARFAQALSSARKIEKNRQEIIDRATKATQVLRDAGFASWYRPASQEANSTSTVNLQGLADAEAELMRENGAG